MALILQNITSFSDQVRATFPMIDRVLPAGAQSGSGGTGIASYAMGFARSLANAAGMFVVALVLTVYFLIEWKATVEWLIGGQLGGVMGALLALPIAAIYPTVERIWLRQRLSDDTVEVHQRLSA